VKDDVASVAREVVEVAETDPVRLGEAISRLKTALAAVDRSRSERMLHNPFAYIYRRLPGQYDALRNYLADAPREVVQQFHRLVDNYEHEIQSEARRAQLQPWRRP
jgi:hypothetical protein